MIDAGVFIAGPKDVPFTGLVVLRSGGGHG